MSSPDGPPGDDQRRRWRLALGGEAAEALGVDLTGTDLVADGALSALYDAPAERTGGLGASAPRLARWLGELRAVFPASVVKVIQRDALDRLDLRAILARAPELLDAVEPDVHLAATLVSLAHVMPARSREAARRLVARIAAELVRRLRPPLHQAVTGGLRRQGRTRRPRTAEIDWALTLHRNLRHYRPELGTVVPVDVIGHARRGAALRDVILCVDQSGSMAASVVYAGMCAAVLASLPAVSTRLLLFDTNVVDLSDQLADPVEVLFGVQLGGGTDIARALAACQALVTRPADTILVLVTDLYEGGVREEMLGRARALVESGVQVIVLLALSDDGAPAWDHQNGAALATLGVPCFACTPDAFPDLMSTALARGDVAAWAASRGIVVAR